MKTTTSVRRQAVFTGHVQGVGFRFIVRHIAERFSVTGYVRNLSDGSVEVVLEGEKLSTQEMLDQVTDRMSPYIDHAEQTQVEPTGEFRSFEIRR